MRACTATAASRRSVADPLTFLDILLGSIEAPRTTCLSVQSLGEALYEACSRAYRVAARYRPDGLVRPADSREDTGPSSVDDSFLI